MSGPAVMLLVEDREDDVLLVRRAFAKANIINPLHVVHDGLEALAYLKGEGPYANRVEFPLPELILLDLKMPGMDGYEVLRWIRKHPTLSALRVVVLASSEEIRDVNLAYKLGANSFLVKPVELERFVEMLVALNGYWLWMSKTPEASRPAMPVIPQSPRKPGSLFL